MEVVHKPNFILITDRIDDQFISKKYIGYSESEAIKKFHVDASKELSQRLINRESE